jgi:putative CocE/NonD family hydrolase
MGLRTEHVTTRDGIRLATDIHLPDGAGPWPVVLQRTPYGRHLPGGRENTAADPVVATPEAFAAPFLAAGYAMVVQDTRGRFGSEGVFVKYLTDGADGEDTMRWLRAQPWCNGQVATLGLSYGAHTQAALGCLDPEGLVAQVLDCGGFLDAWQHGVRQNGAFELRQATWAYKQALLSPEARADPVMQAALAGEDIFGWFELLRRGVGWKPGHSPLRHHPDYEAYLFDQWRHGARDEFWTQLGISTRSWHGRYSRASCVHLSAWFDPYSLGAIGNFLGLQGRGTQRLILGPWTHGERSRRFSGDVDFGAEAPIDSWCGDWRQYRLRFFDHATRGTPDPEPAVRLFVMGGGSGRRTAEGRLDHGGRWLSADAYPLPGTRFTPYHLHNDGTLRREAPAEGAAPLSYDFDPADPVPSIGGNHSSLDPVAHPGSWDQVAAAGLVGCAPPFLPLAARPDVLVFQTGALDRALTIAGPVELDLHVATDGPDTDFTAKLIDVHPPSADYPGGYAMLLADSIVRLRYAEDPAVPRLRRAGEVVRVRLTIFATANLFLPGHRVRLDISSSNFPRFDVNPNTGEPEGAARRRRVACNTVFADAGRASRVVLPVIPG